MQVAIVPIVFGNRDSNEAVLSACASVRDTLTSHGLRVKIDDRDEHPGAKYYRWELKGVPVRIEIGPRDIAKNAVMMVRRDSSEKRSVSIDRIVGEVLDCMDIMLADMYTAASQKFDSRIFDCKTLDEALELDVQGILRVYWCQDPDCGHEIEEVTGLRMLGIPVRSAGSEASTSGPCVVCGRDGVGTLVARTY